MMTWRHKLWLIFLVVEGRKLARIVKEKTDTYMYHTFNSSSIIYVYMHSSISYNIKSSYIMIYITFEVKEGAYDISCPDPHCPTQGVLNQTQMEILTDKHLMEKHRTFRLNIEVSLDANRMWCPSAGCSGFPCLRSPAPVPVLVWPAALRLDCCCGLLPF